MEWERVMRGFSWWGVSNEWVERDIQREKIIFSFLKKKNTHAISLCVHLQLFLKTTTKPVSCPLPATVLWNCQTIFCPPIHPKYKNRYSLAQFISSLSKSMTKVESSKVLILAQLITAIPPPTYWMS